ncbi:MAG: hypothetical protein O7G85_05605, partial [Planctomycetota bacterium]|nr:hypothetical protein [Planctomycetota bacterium]
MANPAPAKLMKIIDLMEKEFGKLDKKAEGLIKNMETLEKQVKGFQEPSINLKSKGWSKQAKKLGAGPDLIKKIEEAEKKG